MNYKEKYEQALNRAKKLYEQGTITESLGYVFPELQEDKGERIRKAIHIYLDWLDGRKDYEPKGDYSIKDMIAWLEKQDENKKLDANKVIAWLVANICDFEYYVKLFKKDFGLTEKGGKK